MPPAAHSFARALDAPMGGDPEAFQRLFTTANMAFDEEDRADPATCRTHKSSRFDCIASAFRIARLVDSYDVDSVD